MLHPIYATVLGHPELIADHLANYGALLQQELEDTSRGLVARTIAGVLAALTATLALGLTGVAVMLGALRGSVHWALIVVPGISVLIAAVATVIALRPRPLQTFADLRSQLEADLHALHLAGERHER